MSIESVNAIQPSHPVFRFSSGLQSFPASGSFPMSPLFPPGGQSIRVSASASVLPMNIQGWFPLGLTGLTSLLSKGLSRVFSSTIAWKHQFFGIQLSLWSNSEKAMVTRSSTLAWKIPWAEEPGRLQSMESMMPSNHLVFCRPPSPPALNSIFPKIRVYSNELALHIRWSNYWNFTSSISPFNEYSRLISFRIDWFDLLVVQGILKSLLQHHSSKTSVLWCSVFFMVQLSHLNMTTEKTIALTVQTFLRKVMSLLFNMLSRFVILIF